jgi:presenilin-like A22 family membrane protease
MTDEKDSKKKMLLPLVIMGSFFVVINGFALLIKNLFQPTFEDTGNPVNILYIFIIIIVMTLIILIIARYWKKQVIQAIILFAIGYTAFFIFVPLFALVLTDALAIGGSIMCGGVLVVLLYKFPEWYIIDLCGVIVGSGAIAIFGVSLSIFLVIVLLVVLAAYDAISVYKTKHMIDLADTVMDLKLPVLLVVPKIRNYSLIRETKSLKEKLKEDEERDAFFMGLGDIVMPGILVVASSNMLSNGLPVALSVIAGTLVGFAVLMTFVIRGKPQAGLPLLCSGAILGFFLSSLLMLGINGTVHALGF